VSPCEQYSLEEMARPKMNYENKQRAITQKIRNAEQQFLCTALLINKIYHPMKFQVYSFLYARLKNGTYYGKGGRAVGRAASNFVRSISPTCMEGF
jgi:hypothetical protein